MVYLIIDGEEVRKGLLVKADNREELERRLKLSETSEVLGSLTDSEMNALQTTSFGVITA